MKRNHIIIIFLISLVLVAIEINLSYARYESQVDVKVNTTTGDIICTAEIDNPGTYYSSDGWAYFKLTIKNYDEYGNISNVPVEYYITVENKDGYSGYYRYLDASGYSNDFATSFKGLTYSFSNTLQESQTINIEVRNDTGESSEIGFDVNVYCNQIAEGS